MPASVWVYVLQILKTLSFPRLGEAICGPQERHNFGFESSQS
jgi:hypothetical protein